MGYIYIYIFILFIYLFISLIKSSQFWEYLLGKKPFIQVILWSCIEDATSTTWDRDILLFLHGKDAFTQCNHKP